MRRTSLSRFVSSSCLSLSPQVIEPEHQKPAEQLPEETKTSISTSPVNERTLLQPNSPMYSPTAKKDTEASTPTAQLAVPAGATGHRKFSLSQAPPVPNRLPPKVRETSNRTPSPFLYPLPVTFGMTGPEMLQHSLALEKEIEDANSPKTSRRVSTRKRNALLCERDLDVLGARDQCPRDGDYFGRERTLSVTEALATNPTEELAFEQRGLRGSPIPHSAPVSRRSSIKRDDMRSPRAGTMLSPGLDLGARKRASRSRPRRLSQSKSHALIFSSKLSTPNRSPRVSMVGRAFGRKSKELTPKFDTVCADTPPRQLSSRLESGKSATSSKLVPRDLDLTTKSAHLGVSERRSSRDRSDTLFPSKTVAVDFGIAIADDEDGGGVGGRGNDRRRSRSRTSAKRRRSRLSRVASSLLRPAGKLLSRRSSRTTSRPSRSRKTSIDEDGGDGGGEVGWLAALGGSEVKMSSELKNVASEPVESVDKFSLSVSASEPNSPRNRTRSVVQPRRGRLKSQVTPKMRKSFSHSAHTYTPPSAASQSSAETADIPPPLSLPQSKSQSELAASDTPRSSTPVLSPKHSADIAKESQQVSQASPSVSSPRQKSLKSGLKKIGSSVRKSLSQGPPKRRSSVKAPKKKNPRSSKSLANVDGKVQTVTSIWESRSKEKSTAPRKVVRSLSPGRRAVPPIGRRFPPPPTRVLKPIRLSEVEAERNAKEYEESVRLEKEQAKSTKKGEVEVDSRSERGAVSPSGDSSLLNASGLDALSPQTVSSPSVSEPSDANTPVSTASLEQPLGEQKRGERMFRPYYRSVSQRPSRRSSLRLDSVSPTAASSPSNTTPGELPRDEEKINEKMFRPYYRSVSQRPSRRNSLRLDAVSPTATSNLSHTTPGNLSRDEENSGEIVFPQHRPSSSRSLSARSMSSGSNESDGGNRDSSKKSSGSFLELPRDDRMQPQRRSFSRAPSSFARPRFGSFRSSLPASHFRRESREDELDGARASSSRMSLVDRFRNMIKDNDRFKPRRSTLLKGRIATERKQNVEGDEKKKRGKRPSSKIKSLSRPGTPPRGPLRPREDAPPSASKWTRRSRSPMSRRSRSPVAGRLRSPVAGRSRSPVGGRSYRKSVSVRPPPPSYFDSSSDSDEGDQVKPVTTGPVPGGRSWSPSHDEEDALAELPSPPATPMNVSRPPRVRPTPHEQKRRSMSADVIDFWSMIDEEEIISAFGVCCVFFFFFSNSRSTDV